MIEDNIRDDKPKIVLMLGYPRSGSTVSGELMNQLPLFLHVGELERLWYLRDNKPSLYPQVICSCGNHLNECDLWQPYVENLKLKIQEINTRENLNLNNRTLLKIKQDFIEKGKFKTKETKIYTEILYAFYDSVYKGENKIILDTSKELWYAEYLESTKLYDISYIHLVRDMRGVVISRQKKMKKVDDNNKINLNYKYLFYDSLRWNWMNFQISKFLENKKSINIRYEDLVRNPQKPLVELGNMMNVTVDPNFAVNTDNEFIIHENHVIHGNRFRFTRGVVKLSEDIRWKKQLKKWDHRLMEKISWFKFPTTTNIKKD